jgi:hypothetical protein
VQEVVVRGLRRRGWDVVRAIDIFPEKTPDDVLFDYAAREGRVLVTNDEGIHRVAAAWLGQGRLFPGLIFWPQEDYSAMTAGDILRAFEALAVRDDPFAYPIQRITPPARAQARERFKRQRRRRP